MFFVLLMLVASDGPLASYSLLMSLPHYQIRIIVDVRIREKNSLSNFAAPSITLLVLPCLILNKHCSSAIYQSFRQFQIIFKINNSTLFHVKKLFCNAKYTVKRTVKNPADLKRVAIMYTKLVTICHK